MAKQIPLVDRHATRALEPGPSEATISQIDLARKPEYLRAVDVFAPLFPKHWSSLDNRTAMVTCQRGRVLYRPDDRGDTLFIIKRGRVNLYRLTADGRKLVTDTLGQYSIFGEMSLVGQRMYGCYAEAAEDCLICVVSQTDMQDLVRKNSEVGLRLLAEVARRFQEREAELESLAFRGLAARLAALLLREANPDGVVGMTHQELAERLGTYRESVSMLLGDLRDAGVVITAPRRIEILDRTSLCRRAETS